MIQTLMNILLGTIIYTSVLDEKGTLPNKPQDKNNIFIFESWMMVNIRKTVPCCQAVYMPAVCTNECVMICNTAWLWSMELPLTATVLAVGILHPNNFQCSSTLRNKGIVKLITISCFVFTATTVVSNIYVAVFSIEFVNFHLPIKCLLIVL